MISVQIGATIVKNVVAKEASTGDKYVTFDATGTYLDKNGKTEIISYKCFIWNTETYEKAIRKNLLRDGDCYNLFGTMRADVRKVDDTWKRDFAIKIDDFQLLIKNPKDMMPFQKLEVTMSNIVVKGINLGRAVNGKEYCFFNAIEQLVLRDGSKKTVSYPCQIWNDGISKDTFRKAVTEHVINEGDVYAIRGTLYTRCVNNERIVEIKVKDLLLEERFNPVVKKTQPQKITGFGR